MQLRFAFMKSCAADDHAGHFSRLSATAGCQPVVALVKLPAPAPADQRRHWDMSLQNLPVGVDLDGRVVGSRRLCCRSATATLSKPKQRVPLQAGQTFRSSMLLAW